MSKILIVVPVKECSTRLPRKNLKPLCGKPLFVWALDAAMEAADALGADLRVVTESVEIAQFAIIKGAGVYIYPDKKLACNPYQTSDACRYALNQLGTENYETLIMVQPSNPFVTLMDIVECFGMWNVNRDNVVRMVTKDRRQHWGIWNKQKIIVPYFCARLAIGVGSVVVVGIDRFLKNQFMCPTIPYYVPKERAIDIDDDMDFTMAEYVMKNKLYMKNEENGSTDEGGDF